MTKPCGLYPAVTKRKKTLFSVSAESAAAQTNNGEVSETSSPAVMMIKLPRNVELLIAEVLKPMVGKYLLGMVLLELTCLIAVGMR